MRRMVLLIAIAILSLSGAGYGQVLVYKLTATFNPSLSYDGQSQGTAAVVFSEKVEGLVVFDVDTNSLAVTSKYPKWHFTKTPADPNLWRQWPRTADYSDCAANPTAILWFTGSNKSKWRKVFGGADSASAVAIETEASVEAVEALLAKSDPNLLPWPTGADGKLLDPNSKFKQFDPNKHNKDWTADHNDPAKGAQQLASFLAWDAARADIQPNGNGCNATATIKSNKTKPLTAADITLRCWADANSSFELAASVSGSIGKAKPGELAVAKSLTAKGGILTKERKNALPLYVYGVGTTKLTLDKAWTKTAAANKWDVPAAVKNIMADAKVMKRLSKFTDVGSGNVPIGEPIGQ